LIWRKIYELITMLSEPFASASSVATALRLTAERVPLAEFDSIIAGFDGVAQEMTAAFAAARWPGMSLEPVIF
jgi:hypothetical protein